ncbi:MAG: hypothetical protein JNM57_08240 [Cyclobacteriaceae bacterium]|nr:hypothetical protein [Cyclobacteriaceae bacterium]
MRWLKTGYNAFLVLAILLGSLNVFRVFAQESLDGISFDRITIPGTVSSGQVTSIVQDKYGFIWFGGNGLFRYDGRKFFSYRDIENDQGGLTSKETDVLFFDSLNNRLLIGTRNYGLVAYNYSTDKLWKLPTPREGTPVVNEIAQTSDGTLWTVSFDGGLRYLKEDTLKKFTHPSFKFIQPTGLLSKGPKLFVGDLHRILVIENKQIIDSIKLEWQHEVLPPYTRITTQYIDRNDNIWIGTEKQGVFVYSTAQKKFIRYFKPTQAPFFSRINNILQDRDGLIWISTKANGLAVYDPMKDVVKHLSFSLISPNSLSSDNCYAVLEDTNGIIWIGATGGVNKYDRKKIKLKHIYHNAFQEPSLSDNMVRGVYEDHAGKVWIGTDGGFINILEKGKKTVQKIKVNVTGHPGNFVPMYFLELDDNVMLIATSLGLIQFNRSTNVFSPFTPLWQETKDNMVRQLIRDGDNLYMLYGGSFSAYNFTTRGFHKHSNFEKATSGSATVMYLDNHQRLYIGVRGGIVYVDDKTKKFKFLSLPSRLTPTDGSLTMVLSLQEYKNKLYAGTFNNGFWEIDIAQMDSLKAHKNFTEKNGLPSNTVYSSIPDKHGRLWMSTNNGIARFDPVTQQFLHFTVSDGLQDNEFNRLTFFQCKNGEFVFGGINGVNIFHPDVLAPAIEHYSPTITSFIVWNPLEPESEGKFYAQPATNFQLHHDENFIRFNFLIPNYREPRHFKTFYKLDKLDADWKEVLYENSASYANLKPDHYTFHVKAVGSNGDVQTTSLSFSIKPPVWQTWWFMSLTVCVVAFLIMTIIRSYIRKAQFDKLRLQEQLKIHTEEIEKSREELMALNQKKDLIFSILSHDLRSPLTTLKGFLGLLIENDFLSKEDVKRHATSIRQSVTNSLDLIDNTLFWSLSQMGNIHYNPTSFALRPVLEKVIALYQLTTEKKKIQVTLECDASITLYADDNMIYVTLRNLISNAIKFTPEGKSISIAGSIQKGLAEIKVMDEGVGMSPEYLKKVLSMDQPMLKTGTSNEKGTGLGLLLCKNFLEINNGTLQIASMENHGTTFIITLPLATEPVATHP